MSSRLTFVSRLSADCMLVSFIESTLVSMVNLLAARVALFWQKTEMEPLNSNSAQKHSSKRKPQTNDEWNQFNNTKVRK